jgi:two-component system chemotaxis response regulator CheY
VKRTVLIADDIPFVRKILKEILQEGLFEVVGEASDGNEAVKLYAQLKPDIVTMDIVMPKLGGIEATRKICDMDSDARIVVVSAMNQETMVMDAISAGARDYILKPFSAQDVLNTLNRILLVEEQMKTRKPTAAGASQ